MANIKSAKKRILVNNKKNELNRSIKSDLKTAVKKLKAMVAENNAEAKVYLNEVFSKLDKAAKENVIHKNAAARKKASLAKLVANVK